MLLAVNHFFSLSFRLFMSRVLRDCCPERFWLCFYFSIGLYLYLSDRPTNLLIDNHICTLSTIQDEAKKSRTVTTRNSIDVNKRGNTQEDKLIYHLNVPVVCESISVSKPLQSIQDYQINLLVMNLIDSRLKYYMVSYTILTSGEQDPEHDMAKSYLV